MLNNIVEIDNLIHHLRHSLPQSRKDLKGDCTCDCVDSVEALGGRCCQELNKEIVRATAWLSVCSAKELSERSMYSLVTLRLKVDVPRHNKILVGAKDQSLQNRVLVCME